MLDSPVSGGPSGAASGKMAIWVGGDEQRSGIEPPAVDPKRIAAILDADKQK